MGSMDEGERQTRERAYESGEVELHNREQAQGLAVGAGREYFHVVDNMSAGTAAKAAAAAEPTIKKTLPADAMHAVRRGILAPSIGSGRTEPWSSTGLRKPGAWAATKSSVLFKAIRMVVSGLDSR